LKLYLNQENKLNITSVRYKNDITKKYLNKAKQLQILTEKKR